MQTYVLGFQTCDSKGKDLYEGGKEIKCDFTQQVNLHAGLQM